MPTVLVTGANRGIGLEFCRQYADEGWRVLATCRRPGEADELKAVAGDVTVYGLDVADRAGIDGLAGRLRMEAIDVLLSNAGQFGPRRQPLGDTEYHEWERVMRTNVFGALKLAEAFTPHVARSSMKRMAFVSSKMGSVEDNTSGGYYIYRSTKAALNAVVRSLSHDLASAGIQVAALHPGWVHTRMGGPDALIEPDESVAGLRRVISGLDPDHSGHFINYDGSEIPW